MPYSLHYLIKMPTIFYGALTTQAERAKVEAGHGDGLVEVLCTITGTERRELRAVDWEDLDKGRAMDGRTAPQYEARKPLILSFSKEGEVHGSGTTLTDADQIRALFSEYGVGNEEDLVGKPVLVYKKNVAKPGQEPLGAGTLAFSRPE